MKPAAALSRTLFALSLLSAGPALALDPSEAVSPRPAAMQSPAAADTMMSLLPESLGAPAVGLADPRGLGAMAVLHDGRVKPLETMARSLLLQWSGRSAYPKRAAISVLADILFAPEKTGDLKLFRIDNPEVAVALRIAPEKDRRYSYREMEPVLHRLQQLSARADSVKEDKRNLVEKEVLRTFSNVVTYLNLTRAMQFALPSNALTVSLPETRSVLNLGNGPTVSFWDLMERAPVMAQILEDIGARGDTTRSPVEDEIVSLSRAMYLQSQTGTPSLLCVVPDPDKPHSWLSPPQVVATPALLQNMNSEIALLAGMTAAYRAGNAADFAEKSEAFNRAVGRRVPAEMENTRFPLELLYNRLDLLFWSMVAFWAALLAGFVFFLIQRRSAYLAACALAGIGWAMLVANIVMRILIMRRPPVTSLFETFPFVAAVSIGVALFLERRTRQGVALLAAAILGALLLSIAGRYAADGDTLQMLVAVLNSNFWLSTHVVCVTIGYAACALAGAIAHIRIVKTAFPGKRPAPIRDVDRMVYGTLCFGLLFSFIGTVLGGIWADQSWGRFWGWDPKENGALLIVLWCATLLHARQWGVIRESGLAVGAVLGAVVVSLAWEGVNLLNVGLHSYGFTQGAAVKLFSYIGAELAFLLVFGGLSAWRQRRA